MQGICLFPAMHRYAVHEDHIRPVFELAASYPGTVVFVHCGVLTVGVRKKLGLSSLFDMQFFDTVPHGTLDLRRALVVSCNGVLCAAGGATWAGRSR